MQDPEKLLHTINNAKSVNIAALHTVLLNEKVLPLDRKGKPMSYHTLRRHLHYGTTLALIAASGT
jgi:hypothetical protein